MRQTARHMLRLFALGDVLNRAVHENRFVRRIESHLAAFLDEAHLAVGQENSVLGVIGPCQADGLAHGAGDDASVVRMHAGHEIVGVDLLLRRFDAEHAVMLVRPVYDIGAEVAGPTADTRDALRFGETGFALLQGRLGTAPRGNVGEGGEQGLAAVPRDGRDHVLHMNDRAVLANAAIFVDHRHIAELTRIAPIGRVLPVLGMDNRFEDVGAHHLFGRAIAIHFGHLLADEKRPAVAEVEHDDALDRPRHQIAEFRVAAARQ